MGKTFKQKIVAAEECDIHLPPSLLDGENIVGVYGFFAIKEGKEDYCFYIGKATNIAGRLLGSGVGHVYQYLNEDYRKIVPRKIKEYRDEGNYKIEVRILKDIDYRDTSFSKAAHRLAFAEILSILEYQKKGQCEFQLPEGSGGYAKEYWEKNYKIHQNRIEDLEAR